MQNNLQNKEIKKLLKMSLLNLSKLNGNFRRPLGPQIFIPLDPTDRYNMQRGIVVKFHIGGVKVAEHLAWHLIFKGCKVTDWFLLSEFLFRNHGLSNELFCACLAGVLSESSGTRKSTLTFNSQLRPIHKKLASFIPRKEINFLEDIPNLLEFVIKVLRIPSKGLPRDRLLTECVTSVQYAKHINPCFVGKGYKDKGSMGPDNALIVIEDEVIEDSLNFEESSSLEFWREFVSLFFQ